MGHTDCDPLTFSQAVVGATSDLRDFARSLTHNVDDTDDLVQATLAKAWAHQRRFTPGTVLQAWLRTILRNTFRDQRRKRKWEVSDPDGYYAQQRSVQPQQIDFLILDDVRRSISLLSAKDREALLLVVDTGLSCDAIARSQGIAVSTFRSRVQRARATLVQAMCA